MEPKSASRGSRLSTSALKRYSLLAFRLHRLINFFFFLSYIFSSDPIQSPDVSLFTSPLLFLSILACNFHSARYPLPPIRFVYARTSPFAISSGWTANSSRGCNCRGTNYRGSTSSGSKPSQNRVPRHLSKALFARADSFRCSFSTPCFFIESLLRENGILRSQRRVPVDETSISFVFTRGE